MTQPSFYGVLLVGQNATLDEIKLAFKRRALQVHPDKGGSKEEFHLVYQALETLANPEARKRYDQRFDASLKPHPSAKASSKPCHKMPGARAGTRKSHMPKKSSGSHHSATKPTAQGPHSKQTKLLRRIRDLLKRLSRDLRNEIIAKQFSQKQRLILERWMVENSEQTDAPGSQLVSAAEENACKNCHVPVTTMAKIKDGKDPTFLPATGHDNCSILSLPNTRPYSQAKPTQQPKPSEFKPRKIKDQKKRLAIRRRTGYVGKVVGSGRLYRVGIRFDRLDMYTICENLQAALDYLVFLTLVKQKFQQCSTVGATFEDRLQESLTFCAKEHGIDLANPPLRFSIVQTVSFFIGPGRQLFSPKVRSIEQLERIRCCLEPFLKYSIRPVRGGSSKSIFWLHSPAHLQDVWNEFQSAVADAWKLAGANSAAVLKKIREHYEATRSLRQKHLRHWELEHMALEDRNRHRPTRLQDVGNKRLEYTERRQMAMNDRRKHQPRSLREKIGPKKFDPEVVLARTLSTLKTLLARWDFNLKLEAQRAHKNHLRQRKAQRMKREKHRKHLETLNRKRLRQLELLRREAADKKMRFDF